MITTIIDTGAPFSDNMQWEDGTLTVAGAMTVKRATILARDSVSGNLVPFVKGGTTNENGIPKKILGHEVVFAGAGSAAVRVASSGRCIHHRLVIHADGDATNITSVVRDQLQDYNIGVDLVTERSVLDNM